MTEIDDKMVERAVVAYMTSAWEGPPTGMRNAIRAALTAALSPKPEIEVTEGMMRAGYEAAGGFYAISEATVENIYRAMESTRLKEAAYAAKSAPQAYLYWDKNDRRQRGIIVMNDRRISDRRGRDRFVKARRSTDPK